MSKKKKSIHGVITDKFGNSMQSFCSTCEHFEAMANSEAYCNKLNDFIENEYKGMVCKKFSLCKSMKDNGWRIA